MKRLNFNTSVNRVLVTADLHLGHDRPFIIGPRGYKDINEAFSHTMTTLYQMLRGDDILINIGDVVIGAGQNSDEYARQVVNLPCKHQYFLWGNHNAGMAKIYDDELQRQFGVSSHDLEIYPVTTANGRFTFLGHYAEMIIDGRPVVFCHYPIASWNELSKNSYMIHGHCHRNLPDNPDLKRLDVGWDWKKRPVTWDEIDEVLRNRELVPPDHHGR